MMMMIIDVVYKGLSYYKHTKLVAVQRNQNTQYPYSACQPWSLSTFQKELKIE